MKATTMLIGMVVMLAAAAASAQTFECVKDNGLDPYLAPARNIFNTWNQGGNDTMGSIVLADWDTAAVKAAYDSYGSPVVTLYAYSDRLWGVTTNIVDVKTANSDTDWAEGDGTYGTRTTFGMFNWNTAGAATPELSTAASNYHFADARWIDAGGGRAEDAALSVQWSHQDGSGAVANFGGIAGDGLTNSPQMDFTGCTIGGADNWRSVVLDAAMMNDLLNNADNRGLFLDGVNGYIGSLQYEEWNSASGPGDAMYLEITPEPATMALLAIGGLALIRRRRRRS